MGERLGVLGFCLWGVRMNTKIRITMVSSILLIVLLVSTHAFFLIEFGSPIDHLTAVGDDFEEDYALGTVYVAESTEVMYVDFLGSFDQEPYEDLAVTMQLPDVMAFELYVNNMMIGRMGTLNQPNLNARNHVYVFPVDPSILKDEHNQFRLSTGHYDRSLLTFYPEISNYRDAQFIAGVKNFILNDLFLMMIVLVVLTNAGLIVIVKRNPQYKAMFYRIVAITTLLVVQSLQFYHFPFDIRIIDYFMLRKIANIAPMIYIMIAFRLISIFKMEDMAQRPFRYWYIDIPAIVFSLGILFAKNYMDLPMYISASLVFVVASFLLLAILILKKKIYDMIPGIFLIIITAAETIMAYLYIVKNLYLAHFGLSFIIVNMYVLAYLYAKRLMDENFTDTLTGAYNRKHLDRIAFTKSYTIVFVDLDNFKKYNDTKGHQAGDDLLVYMVNLMKSYDVFNKQIVRYGGDEFILIAKNEQPGHIADVVENISNEIKKNTEIVSISYGIEPYNGDLNMTLKLADKAMYLNKISKKANR